MDLALVKKGRGFFSGKFQARLRPTSLITEQIDDRMQPLCFFPDVMHTLTFSVCIAFILRLSPGFQRYVSVHPFP